MTAEYVSVPPAVVERFRCVTVVADVMFVNGVLFLVTVGRGLSLITSEYTQNCTAKCLSAGIECIIELYKQGGIVGTVLMDNKFKPLKQLIPSLVINTTAAKEHVPEIERQIRLIKERGHGILNTLPFRLKILKLILIALVYHIILWLNAFPVKSWVSTTLSPWELIIRQNLDFKKHCRSPFGTYCEVHDELTPTNGMESRTHEAICLGPTGNLQGMYKFFSLKSGKRIR